MSKLETVKNLNDTAPQLQIVESVKKLQETATLLHKDMEELPEAVATETAKRLESLDRLQEDVSKALEAYDIITASQREAIDDLTRRMSESATQAFAEKAKILAETISELSRSLEGMRSNTSSMESAARQMEALPGKLDEAQREMWNSSHRLIESANKVRPCLWQQILALVLAGMVGAMVAATGQVVLNRLVPSSAVEREVKTFRVLWKKATPQERELMQKIVNRPEK